jgi:hypothetical protein
VPPRGGGSPRSAIEVAKFAIGAHEAAPQLHWCNHYDFAYLKAVNSKRDLPWAGGATEDRFRRYCARQYEGAHMNCPVCGAEAKNSTPGDFDGLIVECKHCGNYKIRDDALNAFLRLDFDARKGALEAAKRSAKSGATPSIDRASF